MDTCSSCGGAGAKQETKLSYKNMQIEAVLKQQKIEKLNLLEQELTRISIGCSGNNVTEDCYVLSALADHSLCSHDH